MNLVDLRTNWRRMKIDSPSDIQRLREIIHANTRDRDIFIARDVKIAIQKFVIMRDVLRFNPARDVWKAAWSLTRFDANKGCSQ